MNNVVNPKYPDKPVKVTIEQDGNKVAMVVETSEGERDIIKEFLNEYGMVVIGKIPPEQVLDFLLEIMQLKYKLDLANSELKMTKQFFDYACSSNLA